MRTYTIVVEPEEGVHEAHPETGTDHLVPSMAS